MQNNLARPVSLLSLAIGIALSGLASQVFAQASAEILVNVLVPAGESIDCSKLPYPIQVGSAQDLDNVGGASLADFMGQSFSSVSLNDAQNNPLQRDLQYRGFTASPLLGLAQGLAVYQNGAHHEPLGDAVNWDLLPQSAINQITLSGGSNPLYGLNSLGGSLVIDMKNGFNFQGSNVEVSAGSLAALPSILRSAAMMASLATILMWSASTRTAGAISLNQTRLTCTAVSAGALIFRRQSQPSAWPLRSDWQRGITG